ncbi:MAG TPA: VOC family protein [Gaiellaceae bacterium]|nr:VOC family protein [Gaiellaceae bacterium]
MAGDIVHYEISASDVDRAQGFWSGLFGWQFGESVMPEGEYRMARTGEQSGVALSSHGDPGHPNVYFDVDDMDAAIEKIRGLGGSAEGKQPVPGMGWFTACRDTEGNEFSLWQTDSAAGQ